MSKPKVHLIPSVRVMIEVPRSEDERAEDLWVEDDGTIAAFLDWQLNESTFPQYGGMVGPGYLSQWFNAEHFPAIQRFFDERNVP